MNIHINTRVVLLVLSFIGMIVPAFLLFLAWLLEGFSKAACFWCGLIDGMIPKSSRREQIKEASIHFIVVGGLLVLLMFSGYYFFTHISIK